MSDEGKSSQYIKLLKYLNQGNLLNMIIYCYGVMAMRTIVSKLNAPVQVVRLCHLSEKL